MESVAKGLSCPCGAAATRLEEVRLVGRSWRLPCCERCAQDRNPKPDATVESIDGDIATREAAAEAIRQEMETRRAVTIADSRGGPPIVQLHAQWITVDFIDCEAVPTCIDGVMGYFSPLGFAARANWRAVCSEPIQWIQGGADNRQGFRVRYHVFSTGDV